MKWLYCVACDKNWTQNSRIVTAWNQTYRMQRRRRLSANAIIARIELIDTSKDDIVFIDGCQLCYLCFPPGFDVTCYQSRMHACIACMDGLNWMAGCTQWQHWLDCRTAKPLQPRVHSRDYQSRIDFELKDFVRLDHSLHVVIISFSILSHVWIPS